MLDLESTIRPDTCIEGQGHRQKNEMIVRKAGSPLLDQQKEDANGGHDDKTSKLEHATRSSHLTATCKPLFR